MAELKYLVVKTDKGELQVQWGSKRPDRPPQDPNEMRQKALKERWTPAGWEVLHECEDEQAAEVKLQEELDKLPNPKQGDA